MKCFYVKNKLKNLRWVICFRNTYFLMVNFIAKMYGVISMFCLGI